MDTKTALLDSAETSVRSMGFDGFSYADLAADVGIRKASIHYHFPKKSDLAEALMARYTEGLEAHLARIAEASASGGARIAGQIDRYQAALEGGRKLCLCVAFSVNPDEMTPALVALLEAYRIRSVAWMTEAFALAAEDGSVAALGDPEAEARGALALLEGAHLAARVAGDPAVFGAATAHLRARLSGLSDAS